jgi:AraC-like DNA-binding protein
MGSVSGRMVVRVVRLLREAGVGPEGALREAGLTEARLTAPGARVPMDAADLLLESAHALLGAPPDFSLRLATTQEPDTYDTPGLVLAASPTLREGLTRAFRFQRAWGDGERFGLLRLPGAGGGGTAVVFRPTGPPRPAHRLQSEVALVEVVLGARFLAGAPDAAPRAVRFTHAEAASAAPLSDFFGVAPAFGAARTEVVLEDALLDAPLPNAHALFLSVFERQAEASLAQLPAEEGALAPRVRAHLRGVLAGGAPDVPSTARRLGLTARTLQRRLAQEGVSHATLLEEVRREACEGLLARGLPLAEVAALLGYADAPAFHRAFKRWHGVSPERFLRGERAGRG